MLPSLTCQDQRHPTTLQQRQDRVLVGVAVAQQEQDTEDRAGAAVAAGSDLDWARATLAVTVAARLGRRSREGAAVTAGSGPG
jgi:hypothetical protein